MAALRHDGHPCLGGEAESDQDLICLFPETVQFFDMPVIGFVDKTEFRGPTKV